MNARAKAPRGNVPAGAAAQRCAAGEDVPRAVRREVLAHFDEMIPHALDHAGRAREQGRPVVGIMCEFTPREIIMAAGAVPVCLCGGSAEKAAVAEACLPVNLCPLIKSTFGYHMTGSNPFLEMASLVVAETTCDGKKKMYELMGETRPMYVLELPQKPDDPGALDAWLAQLHLLKRELQRRFHTRVTDAKLRRAVREMNRERGLRRALASVMKEAHPPLTGCELLLLKSSISCIPGDMSQYERLLGALDALPRPTGRDRRVRVLMTGVPTVYGAERVIEIVEANGGIVVAAESCTGLKPVDEDVDEHAEDPMRALAEKYLHLPCSVMTPNLGRIALMERLAGAYRAECVVELVWTACLTYDVEARRIRRWAEEERGLPYLRIETDYNPADSARIAVRVEALFETVRARARRGKTSGRHRGRRRAPADAPAENHE